MLRDVADTDDSTQQRLSDRRCALDQYREVQRIPVSFGALITWLDSFKIVNDCTLKVSMRQHEGTLWSNFRVSHVLVL